jgi:hypothetical protein
MPRQPFALVVFVSALAALVLTAAPPPAAAGQPGAAATEVRRIALLVGADDGGPSRVKLRYAGSDAARMARVIRELGGVAPDDAILVRSSRKDRLLAGLADARARVEASRRRGERTEVLVYYSGHSDETGLLLGGERLGYRELRDALSAIPSDVHVAVLDSCASGAFTRLKGGAARPSFLIDASSRVSGYAYIASSSATESAQESDRIAASYFTHAFASGLRGGADANRDRKVTLNEAYQYAFAETVSRTESTQAGAQHPAYNLHLVGTGDVVMTDLRATSASLVLGKDLDGRLFVRDAGGALIIELAKTAGRPVELGLAPGRYHLTLRTGGKLYAASAVLAAGRRVQLAADAFRVAELEVAVARGEVPSGDDRSAADRGAMTEVPFAVSVVAPLSTHSGITRPRKRVSLNLFSGTSAAVDGVELGGLVNLTDEWVHGVQVAGLSNIVSGDAEGVQVAGLLNLDRGSTRGIQAAGLVNLVGERARGVQVAGLANVVDREAGALQVAGLANSAGGVRGAQVAGLGNLAADALDGGQVAGLANFAPSGGRGLQVAGVTNLAGSLTGVQLAGVTNVAADVDVQVAGVVNVADQVRGVQLGLVNVARESDVSLGLVNVVGNGYRAVEAWASDIAPVHLGVKLGARRTYTQLSAASTDDRFLAGGALGVHFPAERFHVDVDVGNHAVWSHDGFHDGGMLSQLRAALGWHLHDHVAIFAGAQLSAAFQFDGDTTGLDPALSIATADGDDVVVRFAPGVFAGVAAF